MQGAYIGNANYQIAAHLEDPMHFRKRQINVFNMLEDLINHDYVKRAARVRKSVGLDVDLEKLDSAALYVFKPLIFPIVNNGTAWGC